jgi:hypothetical protein
MFGGEATSVPRATSPHGNECVGELVVNEGIRLQRQLQPADFFRGLREIPHGARAARSVVATRILWRKIEPFSPA